MKKALKATLQKYLILCRYIKFIISINYLYKKQNLTVLNKSLFQFFIDAFKGKQKFLFLLIRISFLKYFLWKHFFQ